MRYFKNLIKYIAGDNLPKIHSIIFNKDRILNSPGKKSYFFLNNYLDFFKYKIIPFKQVTAYGTLIKFKSICNNLGISIYAAHGTLLGMIRANAFAGRPKDLDFYITKDDMDKVIGNIDLFISNSIKPYRCKIYKGVLHLKPKQGVPIALIPYKFNPHEDNYQRDFNYFENKDNFLKKYSIFIYRVKFTKEILDNKQNTIIFSKLKLKEEENKIFNTFIKVPSNYLELLKFQYGEDWEIPKGKQNG